MNTVLSIKGPIEEDDLIVFQVEVTSPSFGDRILGASLSINKPLFDRIPIGLELQTLLRRVHVPDLEIDRIVPEFITQSSTGLIVFKSIINNYEWKP